MVPFVSPLVFCSGEHLQSMSDTEDDGMRRKIAMGAG